MPHLLPMGPVPPMTLLEGLVELFVTVGPGGLLEITLRCNCTYHIEGYGIVPFVWEEVKLIYPADLPLGG